MRKNLKNQTFGSWFVEEYDESKKKWKLKCKCGNIGYAKTYTLLSGGSTRCCKCRDKVVGLKNSTHRLSKTKLHGVWNTMKQRCSNPNNSKYQDYGGRGIIVCDEWRKDFKAFYLWAISNGYLEGLSIDRIDVNGDYAPDNCRWVTEKVQANNIRRNRIIVYNEERHTLSEWAEIKGIQRKTLDQRLKRGWTVERALNEKPFIGKNQSFKAGGYSD